MLELYYHPILGLQYNFYNPDVIIDIQVLGKHYISFEECMAIMAESGVQMVDSKKQNHKPIELIKGIRSNSIA